METICIYAGVDPAMLQPHDSPHTPPLTSRLQLSDLGRDDYETSTRPSIGRPGEVPGALHRSDLDRRHGGGRPEHQGARREGWQPEEETKEEVRVECGGQAGSKGRTGQKEKALGSEVDLFIM